MKTKEKKQVKTLGDLKPKELEQIKDNKSDNNEKISKYKDIFNELSNERMDETYSVSRHIDFAPINFLSFKGPLHIYSRIKNGEVSIKK